MSLAQQWFEQGRRKGRQEGLREGRQEGLREGLRRVLLRAMEAKGFQVTDEFRQRVEACDDIATLEAWHTRVLDAATPDEIFGE